VLLRKGPAPENYPKIGYDRNNIKTYPYLFEEITKKFKLNKIKISPKITKIVLEVVSGGRPIHETNIQQNFNAF